MEEMKRILLTFALLFLHGLTANAQSLSSNIPVSEINALIQFGQLLRSPLVIWSTNQNFCSQQGIICSSDATGQLTVSGINLANSQLTGILSPSLADLQNLRFIDLSNNSVTGTIPPSYGSIANLTNLNMNENRLFGTIPYTFSQLQSLRVLNLANNYMAGGLPPNFNINQLNSLLLAGNQFCPLPDYSQVNNNDYLANSNLSGCQICNSYSCLNGAQCTVNTDQTFRCACGANYVGQYCELALNSYGPQPQSTQPNNQTNTNQTSGGPVWGQGNPGVQPADSSPAPALAAAGLIPLFGVFLATLFFLNVL